LNVLLLCITINPVAVLTKLFKGLSPVAKKQPDRAIYSGTGGPAQLYLFVDVASFTEDWADLKLGDDELRALEDEIARNPTRAPVVPGGGGARKIRRPNPTSGKGKSSGYRVLYAFLPAHGIILLIAAWPKSEREDLQPDDYKAISKIIARIQKLLNQGRIS
jgi:mRNA-degrading endonuclease RelE of RelBE toxin-antitoxin system